MRSSPTTARAKGLSLIICHVEQVRLIKHVSSWGAMAVRHHSSWVTAHTSGHRYHFIPACKYRQYREVSILRIRMILLEVSC